MSFDDLLNSGAGTGTALSFGRETRDAEQWLPHPDGTLKWRGGTIINEPTRVPQYEYDVKTGKKGPPKKWDNGDDKMQLAFPLQTNERDGGPLDDGKRTLYAKIQGDFEGDLLSEIRRARTAAGGDGGEALGSQLYVALVGLKQTGGQPQRLYKAHFIPAPTQLDQHLTEAAPQQQPVQQPAQGIYGPSTQHAAGAPSQPVYAGPQQQQQPVYAGPQQYQQAPPMVAPPAQQPTYAGPPNGQVAPQQAPPVQQQQPVYAGPQQAPPVQQQQPVYAGPQQAPPVQTERPPWEQ